MTATAAATPEPALTPEHLSLLLRISAAQAQARTQDVFKGTPPRWRDWGGFADFCEAEMRIVNKAKEMIPFRLNTIQRMIVAHEIRLRRAKKKPWLLILKHRKPGITTLEQVLAYWTIWRRPHQECMTLAHAPKDTRIIFRMVSRLWKEQSPEHRHLKTNATVSMMEFKEWDGLYTAATAGTGATARGATLSRVHGSECGFWPDMDATHTGLSKSLGQNSAYVLESTPNGQEGAGQAFYEFWLAAKAGQNDFSPVFLPWFIDPRNRIELVEPDEIDATLKADDEVRELMQRHQLSKEQMKWWLDERRGVSATGRNAAKIHQEHPSDPETCFLMSTLSYYDESLLRPMDAAVRPPLAVEENGRLRIWDVPDEDEPATYIIGADPSGGTGGDNAAAVGFNLKTGTQAFTWSDNRTSPGAFGEVLGRLGRRWANPSNQTPAFVICENNNHGHAALVGLLVLAQYPRDRVYHMTDDAKVNDFGETQASPQPGWTHGVKQHADLTEALARLLRDQQPQVRDERVAHSIRHVTSGPRGAEFTGRDEATATGLCVIGWPHAAAPTGFALIGGRVIAVG